MKRPIVLAFLIGALLMAVGGALAQETPPVGGVIVESTPEATPTAAPGNSSSVTVNVGQPAASEDTPPPATDTVRVSSWAMLLGYLVAFIVGGVSIGTPLTLVIVNMTKTQKDMAEKLFLAQPPSAIERERYIVNLATTVVSYLGRVLGVAREVTDGLPNTDSPPLTEPPTLPTPPPPPMPPPSNFS